LKLRSVYTELSFKQVFENATTSRNSVCRSVVNGASCNARFTRRRFR